MSRIKRDTPRVSKYIEGFYCMDENAVNRVSNDNRRTVLGIMSKSYPYGETINNIQRKNPYNTEFIPAIGTVKDELSHLTKGGFLVRDHREEVDQKNNKKSFHI